MVENDILLITDNKSIIEFLISKEAFLKVYIAEEVLKDIENFVVKNYE
jgi:hypothetical protein